jgi:hypothetical protein
MDGYGTWQVPRQKTLLGAQSFSDLVPAKRRQAQRQQGTPADKKGVLRGKSPKSDFKKSAKWTEKD